MRFAFHGKHQRGARHRSRPQTPQCGQPTIGSSMLLNCAAPSTSLMKSREVWRPTSMNMFQPQSRRKAPDWESDSAVRGSRSGWGMARLSSGMFSAPCTEKKQSLQTQAAGKTRKVHNLTLDVKWLSWRMWMQNIVCTMQGIIQQIRFLSQKENNAVVIRIRFHTFFNRRKLIVRY